MLLNIDKPHRTAKLHQEGCEWVPDPYGTQRKPVGMMGRDGGWFVVADEEEGRSVAKREFKQGKFKRCEHC